MNPARFILMQLRNSTSPRNKPRSGMPAGGAIWLSLSCPRGRGAGGLFFGHPEPGRCREADEGLVAGLAGQAAVAIENARLIQQVCEANDMLEQRVSERTAELTEAHEALRHAQKLEAIGQLTGGVAHDFNNLLTVIAGAAEMLARSDLAEQKRARYVENIASTAKRAATLTSHLLAFSRRRVIRPEVVDLNIQIDALEEVLARSLWVVIFKLRSSHPRRKRGWKSTRPNLKLPS